MSTEQFLIFCNRNFKESGTMIEPPITLAELNLKLKRKTYRAADFYILRDYIIKGKRVSSKQVMEFEKKHKEKAKHYTWFKKLRGEVNHSYLSDYNKQKLLTLFVNPEFYKLIEELKRSQCNHIFEPQKDIFLMQIKHRFNLTEDWTELLVNLIKRRSIYYKDEGHRQEVLYTIFSSSYTLPNDNYFIEVRLHGDTDIRSFFEIAKRAKSFLSILKNSNLKFRPHKKPALILNSKRDKEWFHIRIYRDTTQKELKELWHKSSVKDFQKLSKDYAGKKKESRQTKENISLIFNENPIVAWTLKKRKQRLLKKHIKRPSK